MKATTVDDKFTVASSVWTYQEYSDPIKMLADSVTRTVVKGGKLNVAQDQKQPWEASSEDPVALGDIVDVEVESVIVPVPRHRTSYPALPPDHDLSASEKRIRGAIMKLHPSVEEAAMALGLDPGAPYTSSED